ncbi:hypothetical protein [Dyadobacter sp. CY261]|uniref:hypothetical protein n=1 Tax=Dyadobacter sp. CY261 TaxID=2907203 RepID=UPI001F1E1CF6|nr:hypothetical protein [Dyadobacter sp. CY261]
MIQSVKTQKIIKVKRGQFLQCIQKNSFGQESFVFGEVTTIRHDGVILRENPFIRGSGGFVFYEDIVNIDKIKIIKRTMLSASICGIALGELTVAFSLTKKIMGPVSGIATYFVLDRAVRRKSKSLFNNRVPEMVILVPPGVGIQDDHYFEPSSSLNHPE